jgi:tripartite ATP-independent transporter DctP family solute receptor
MNRIIAVIVVFGAALWIYLFAANHRSSYSMELKLAHALPQTHPVHRAMVYFADEVKKRTDERITVVIFPGGQLGQERDLQELVQAGALDMSKTSAAVLEGFKSDYMLFALPFIFRNEAHYYNVLNGPLGVEFLDNVDSLGLVGLTYYTAGARSFYTIKKVETPDDLRGLKIRVQMSATAIGLMNALGAVATPLDGGEIYTALQTGVIDGAENNIPTYVSSLHYELAKNFIFDEHQMIPDMLIMSKASWERLEQEDQEIIRQAALDSFEYQKQLWQEAVEQDMVTAENAGVTFRNANKELFIERAAGFIKGQRERNPKIDAWLTQIAETEG